MSSELKIRTPEGIDFSLPLAGPVSRCLAYLVDVTAVSVVIKVLAIVAALFAIFAEDITSALVTIVIFAAQIVYGIMCEWLWRGQTIGKRLLNLRVVDEQGLRLEFTQVVVRNLLRMVDALPGFYAVGGIACLCSKRCQRLGDLAANTVVVRALPLQEPDLDQLTFSKYNSLAEQGHLAARLRQRISPQEAGVALEALLRRDAFDPATRVTLFAEIAQRFKSLVVFPPEAVETLTDEQYLRNVVDILFRSKK